MQKSFKIQVQIVSMALKQMSHEHQAKGESIDLVYYSLYFNSVNSVSSVAKN
jgi:hypothetical protein